MLEQAIIDAKALKEAALKNAETAIIEKYQDEVRTAVENLLEQEEDELGLGMEEPAEEEGVSVEAPEAFSEGEKLCACPEMEEEITIDFDSLRAEMMEEEDEEEDDKEDDEEAVDFAALAEALEESDEEVEITEDKIEQMAKEIAEELSVDLKAVGSGTIGVNSVEREEASDFAIAAMRDDEVAAEEEEHLKAVKDLQDRLSEALSSNKELSAKSGKYEKAVSQLKEKLDEANLSNAKLLYTNRVLSSASLNERQKSKLVEAIDKADSIEGTKTIFETLQESLVSGNKRAPKTLNEVANNRNSSPFIPRKQKLEESVEDVFSKRMRVLAGIKS